jgi:hypothetical protein
LISGQRIFCDAAWTKEENTQSSSAGIGVIIQLEDNEHRGGARLTLIFDKNYIYIGIFYM